MNLLKRDLWAPFRNSFSIPTSISGLIFYGTGCITNSIICAMPEFRVLQSMHVRLPRTVMMPPTHPSKYNDLWMNHVTCECVMLHLKESCYIWTSHLTCEWIMLHAYDVTHGYDLCIRWRLPCSSNGRDETCRCLLKLSAKPTVTYTHIDKYMNIHN